MFNAIPPKSMPFAGEWTPLDITSIACDYPLRQGEVVYSTYSNATSVPLKVATVQGSYEIEILGNNSSYNNSSGWVLLKPNNLTDLSNINVRKQENSLLSTGLAQHYNGSVSGLFLGAYILKYSIARVNTYTLNKTLIANCITSYATQKDYGYHAYSLWQDTTTAWTSLGTLCFGVAQSGTVIIRRIL